MTAPLIPRASVEPGSRLDDLLATYAHLKPEADELAGRLKSVTDAIKAELSLTILGTPALQVDVAHVALAQPLRLSYVERWDLDTKRMKVEDPEAYVRFARKSGRWELRGVKP